MSKDYSNTWAARILNAEGPFPPTSAEIARFWRNVSGPDEEGHRRYTGYRGKEGYGVFSLYREGKWRRVRAHRLSYFLYHGNINPNLTIDHICRERDCQTNSDLVEKTRAANILATPFSTASINKKKTHCPHYHPLSGTNLRIGTGGRRICIACDEAYKLEYNRKYYNVQRPRGKYKARKKEKTT